MCRAIREGGRRCPSHFDAFKRVLANISQRIGRHDRKSQEAAARQNWDREAHYAVLLEKAIRDYENAAGNPQVNPTEFPPTIAHRYTPEASIEMTVDELCSALNQLNHDPAAQEQIMNTLDLREEVRRQADADVADGLAGKRRARAEQEAKWLAEWATETSPLTNPARRTYRRLTPEQACTEEYRTYLDNAYLQAENDCRGVLLNREGQSRSIDPESLFSGPASRVNKYASDELKTWFGRNGRYTMAEWKYHWFNRESDRNAAKTARLQSIGEAVA